MKLLLVSILLCLIATSAYSQDCDDCTQQMNRWLRKTHEFNPYTGKWEPNKRQKELKLNVFDGTWSYQDHDSTPRLNPFTGKWEYTD